MATGESVRAWRPGLPGVDEVLHAHFTEHAYPLHTHRTWTVLIVDDGGVSYQLDRQRHGADQPMITLLPPHVAHDGRPVDRTGFHKRVVYLEPETIGEELIGSAVDQPELSDRLLRHRLDQLHRMLPDRGDELEAESRLLLIIDRLRWHLLQRPEQPTVRRDPGPAARLRELLDDQFVRGVDLQTAGQLFGRSPTSLIRAFTKEYGLPPHRYQTGRRVERARRLLLDGLPAADVAVEAGFYDQAHLTRHLRRMLGTTPEHYRRAQLR